MTYLVTIYIICHLFAEIRHRRSEAYVEKIKDYVFMSFFTTFKIFSLFGIAQVNLALLSHIEKILS